jgi:flagellin
MSLYVNTNVSSLNAQRQLMTSGNGLNTAFERLSSGFRINSASDDAAGLQITNRMTSQINGLNQAVRNANDGISVAQVAEGALQETGKMLQRMRELVVQADNGINNAEDRNAIEQELNELAKEVDRVANTTQFSGENVLNGTFDKFFLVGANGGTEERIQVEINAGEDGAGDGLAFSFANLIASGDDAVAEADLAKFLTGDATDETRRFDLSDYEEDGEDVSLFGDSGDVELMLQAIDNAIETVGSSRAELGAIQNRFQSTIANLTNVSENVSGARSRIMDTDFAAETAKLTQFQITQQASTSILAQANQRPQAALSLL